MTTDQARYSTVAIYLHWLIAILMIIMVFFGEDLMGEAEEGGEAAQAVGTALPSLHVSIGVAVLLLTLLRLVWRAVNPPPPYPATMKPIEVKVSKLMHGLFYILMVGLPLTGWLAFSQALVKRPELGGASLFGIMPVPGAPQVGSFIMGIHNLGSKVAMVLIILHVLAALKHQFIDRDGIMQRMSPH